MRSPLSTEVPVLVVGAGPAGLAAALTLAHHGIQATVVERRPGPPSLPRATGVSTRTMELMRAWGLEEAVRAGANDVDWRLWWCETLAQAAEGRPVFVGLPTMEQSAVLSPTGPACVPQDHLEPVLERRLRELGHPGVERGTELRSLETSGDGVVARLRAADGEERDVHAAFVVAADGAHSTVRRRLGIAMHGVERTDDRIAALFRAPLWDVVGERRYGLYWTTAGGGNAVLPAGLSDRWLLGTEWRPHEERLDDYDEARVGTIIRAAAGVPDLPLRIERIAAVEYAAARRRALPRGPGLPRGRRGAPRLAARRDGPEHRDPRRARPGLAAGLGAAGLGRRRRARRLRARAPSGRRAQRAARGGPGRLGERRRRRDCRGSRRAHAARVGARRRRAPLDARPGRAGPDALRRARGGALGGGRGDGRRAAAARGPPSWSRSRPARSASRGAAPCWCARTACRWRRGRATPTPPGRCAAPSTPRSRARRRRP